MKKKPEGMNDLHFEYLDNLRESSEVNMFGAARYLSDSMNVPLKDAKEYLAYWMVTFDKRQKEVNNQSI